MNASEAIVKIKEMLGLKFSDETEQKFATTYLEDGTTQITNDRDNDFELGDVIYVVGEDGTLTPAPIGDHTTQEGFVVVLDEESKIVEIREMEVEDVVEEVVEEEVVEELKEEAMDFESELKSIKSSIEQMLNLMEKTNNEFNKEMEDLKNEFNSFKKSPSSTGIKEPKSLKEDFNSLRVDMFKKAYKK